MKLKKIDKNKCVIVIVLLIVICGCFYNAFQKDIDNKFYSYKAACDAQGSWSVQTSEMDLLFDIYFDGVYNPEGYLNISESMNGYKAGSKFPLYDIKYSKNKISFIVELTKVIDNQINYFYFHFDMKINSQIMQGISIAKIHYKEDGKQKTDERKIAIIMHKIT